MCLVGVVVASLLHLKNHLTKKARFEICRGSGRKVIFAIPPKAITCLSIYRYMNNQTLRKRNDKPIHQERSRTSVYYCHRDSPVDILLYFLERIHRFRRRLREAQSHRLFRYPIASLSMHIIMVIYFSCDSLQLIDWTNARGVAFRELQVAWLTDKSGHMAIIFTLIYRVV